MRDRIIVQLARKYTCLNYRLINLLADYILDHGLHDGVTVNYRVVGQLTAGDLIDDRD